MCFLTWPREAAGTKLEVGKGEPSSVNATTAVAVTTPDAAFGVMLSVALQTPNSTQYEEFVRLLVVSTAEEMKQAGDEA